MSKSKKLPICKDRGIAQHSTFRRKIKRRISQRVINSTGYRIL